MQNVDEILAMNKKLACKKEIKFTLDGCLSDLTKDRLSKIAASYEIPQRSKMKKDQLVEAIKITMMEPSVLIDKLNGSYGYVYNANGSDDIELNKQGGMLKTVYDTNNNGIVDNAEKVNNHTVLKDVPANAQFTDTTVATSLRMSSGITIEQAIHDIQESQATGSSIDEGYYSTY